jgi:four helix bundle protein
MGIKRVEEIIAWQLGMELHQRVVEITRRPECARHLKFCEQVLDSSSSVSSNIAEGFLRYTIPELMKYLRIASASLGETETRLRQALGAGWIAEKDMASIGPLIGRIGNAIGAFRRSIQKFKKLPRRGKGDRGCNDSEPAGT